MVKSDLNKKNSMTKKKSIGEFDEDFREVPIIDNKTGERTVAILKPPKGGYK